MKIRFLPVMLLLLLVGSTAWGAQVIQTQPATWGGIEADLLEARVRGKVLTVEVAFRCVSAIERPLRFRFADLYFTDLSENRKYYPLKDTSGRYLAGPAHDYEQGGTYQASMKPGDRFLFWAKFPAPAVTTQSVDIFIPGFLPFEGVPISRQ